MEPQKTLQECTETELKALAYDQIAASEQAQRNINAINQEIQARHMPKQPISPEEDKVPTPYHDPLDTDDGEKERVVG